MGKQLSIANLEEEISHFDEVVEVDFEGRNGEKYTIKIKPFFKPEKVRNLVVELIDFYKKAEEEKLKIPEFEQEDLIPFFIIKHFTNIKFTRSKKAKKVYEEFKTAINAAMFIPLLDAFPQESIQAVYERIYDQIEKTAQFKEKYLEQAQAILGEMKDNTKVLYKPESKSE
ncbi:hypothetical protein ANABIO32_44880 [Rossellomorea marisflavi]|uniref:hypothetical protein n=1 Tax=Rossellomorea marisflavi TaxID=189381 RepID=UPI0025CAE492|nr:hypothetical protein [Rossellomorea marisflavi]GLI86641.1 hypothetical protein ANABIO32_44880 [Rossellomorea marisflavi]